MIKYITLNRAGQRCQGQGGGGGVIPAKQQKLAPWSYTTLHCGHSELNGLLVSPGETEDHTRNTASCLKRIRVTQLVSLQQAPTCGCCKPFTSQLNHTQNSLGLFLQWDH